MKTIKTRSIKDMTEEELFHIANIATGGYFTSDVSREHKEVETGGYGWRRRIEWIQNSERYDEYHYFEITGEYRGKSWAWHCKATDEMGTMYPDQPNWGKGHLINTLNPMKIVDYCREQGLDIENEHRKI